MKKILLSALVLFLLGTLTTQASLINVNTVYDNVANRLQQIPNAVTAVFRANNFQATSTIATSTFPVASSTTFCLGSDCRTAWPSGGGGGSTTTINGVQGNTFTFATGTATGIGLNLSTTTGTVTFTPTVSSGYNIPLTASTTNWEIAFASTTNMTPTYTRSLFSNTVTGLTYTAGTGVTSLTAGYNIPLSASTTQWQTAFASTSALNATSPVVYTPTTGNFSIAADGIGDTQLAFNTGQNLTTASSPTFASTTMTNLTSALIRTTAGGVLEKYTGSACTNQFVTSLNALGVTTCASVSTTTMTAIGYTSGYVLQASTTAPGGMAWVATSTLGLGNVVGPASAVDSAFAIFQGTTGKVIQNYNVSDFLLDYGLNNSALNARDTANRNRANHTGTQSSTTITGLGTLAGLSSVNLTSNVTGILPTANGGTGTSTYATGDMLYATAANTLGIRTIGATGSVLSVVGGVPTWVATSTLGLGGGGGGSGTVNSGLQGQLAYYASDGTAVSGTSTIYIATSTGRIGLNNTAPSSTLSVRGLATTSLSATLFDVASSSGASWFTIGANGSSTIGGGTTQTGLTINGGATSSSFFVAGEITGLGNLLLTGATAFIQRIAIAEPSAPSSGRLISFVKNIAGKLFQFDKNNLGESMPSQNALWNSSAVFWKYSGATAGTWSGTSAGSGNGTYSSPVLTTTSVYRMMRRGVWSNVVTTANQVIGQRNTESIWFRGDSTTKGGFYTCSTFGFDTWTNGSRAFFGLHSATTVVSSDPSSLNNTVGFAVDAADNGAISFLTRNASTATKASTGLTIVTGKGYRACFYSAAADTQIGWWIKDILTGTEASGTATTTLPVANTILAVGTLASNAALTPVNSVQLGVNQIYVQSDY